LCEVYSLNRYIPPEDDWPPFHPEPYTSLPCVYNERRSVESGDDGLEKSDIQQRMFVREGLIDKKTRPKMFNSVRDLFNQLKDVMKVPSVISIEGASGIGKTILCKEIAMHWVYSTILHNVKLLFMLYMSDPLIKNITTILFLVGYFYKDNILAGIVADWLIETDGKYLIIVMDGYDEFYKDHFLTDIISHKLLSKCSVVFTSCPGASSHIDSNIDLRIEMLHFSEADQHNYINHALRGKDNQNIMELLNILPRNACIDALCCIPQNMNMLLSIIYSDNNINKLPETQVAVYEIFIVKTINYFVQVHNEEMPLLNVSCVSDLPQPYHTFVMELCRLAFWALQRHKLVFALHEVKDACPKLTNAYENGIGLLRPMYGFKPQDNNGSKTFTFICFSIQEYLASIYIASLPDKEQTQIVNKIICENYFFKTIQNYFAIPVVSF